MDLLVLGLLVGTASVAAIFGRWAAYRLTQVIMENKEDQEK